jgi:hypothetical protein
MEAGDCEGRLPLLFLAWSLAFGLRFLIFSEENFFEGPYALGLWSLIFSEEYLILLGAS